MYNEMMRSTIFILLSFIAASNAFYTQRLSRTKLNPIILGNDSPSHSSSSLVLHMTETTPSTTGGGRRDFFRKTAGALVATGITMNGIAVQGPNPYTPPPQSLLGKNIIITGGNTGLGLESAKRLATAGASIILTSRDMTKGNRAVQTVKDYVKEKTGMTNDNVFCVPLDLCDFESIKAFPGLLKQIKPFQDGGYIDVLMNNAGVMAIPTLQYSKDGFEKTFQSNHLGHFALTALLAPSLNPQKSRIVNVSSGAYLIALKGLDMTNLNSEQKYDPWEAYGRSKLENILFTKELQRRADLAGKNIVAVSLHPGAVRTDLQRYIVGEDKFVSMQDVTLTTVDILKALPLFYFTKSVDRGANSQIYLASFQGDDDAVKGQFFQNMKEQALQPCALDMEKAKELWDLSEKLSGVPFEF